MALTHAPYIKNNLQEWINVSRYPEEFTDRTWTGERDQNGYAIYEETKGIWVPNEPFHAVLEYAGWYSGRSAVRVNWTNMGTGGNLPMFFKDFDQLMGKGLIQAGVRTDGNGNTPATVEGIWVVVKRGANYGVQLVESV